MISKVLIGVGKLVDGKFKASRIRKVKAKTDDGVRPSRLYDCEGLSSLYEKALKRDMTIMIIYDQKTGVELSRGLIPREKRRK